MPRRSSPGRADWRPVPDFEGWYEVNREAAVRRVAPGLYRPGYLLTPHRTWDRHGRVYLCVTLTVGSEQWTLRLHRIVAAAFPELVGGTGPYVTFVGSRLDCRPENLVRRGRDWSTRPK